MLGSKFAYSLVLLAVFSARAAFAAEPAPDCSRQPGSLPRPTVPAGTPDPANPIEHIVVMMLENHSFDNVLGALTQPEYYGGEIDGITPGLFNRDPSGSPVSPFHLGKDCIKDMDHSWDGAHAEYNGGANDGFVRRNDSRSHDGYRAMGYYDQRDYPLMYFLADHYSVADRYFSSVMGPTHSNRMYMYSATSRGHIRNQQPNYLAGGWTWKTIFEQLNDAGVSWTYYVTDLSDISLFSRMYLKNLKHFRHVSKFKDDATEGKLAQVVFIENSSILGDEHPPSTFQITQHAVSKDLQALIDSPMWATSAFFVTYDEGGGSFDHVPPPRACVPDNILPVRSKGEKEPGGFDRYGFRVPAVVVSPWAKRHHVSHEVYDHSSILKFIETKFNIPALTARDANADPMLEMFDFNNPDFYRPTLPEPKVRIKDLVDCLFKKGYRD
jgi:phospholipase C